MATHSESVTSLRSATAPSLLDAIIPLVSLMISLGLAVYLFGTDASGGAIQIGLVIASGVAMIMAVKNGHRWSDLEAAIVDGVAVTVNAMLILLMVGAVIGIWILAGTVPAMIYYGLKLINPEVFYVTACVVCCIGSFATGSSWSAIGTIGLGLFGGALALGVSPEITAGAIISGAYFGDKMSPLSDTTNLSPAVAGTDVFTHIKAMVWTTVPAIILALLVYAWLGLDLEAAPEGLDIGSKLAQIETTFNVGPHLLLPMAFVVVLAWFKVPALPAMMLSALSGVIFALVFQWDLLLSYGDGDGFTGVAAVVKGVWSGLTVGFVATTPDADLNALLSRGGMSSILSTVWLIICAMMFGSIMEKCGFLERLIAGLLAKAKSTGSLIVTTVCTCIGINIVAADQFISIVLPGRMYEAKFRQRNLAPENLSRILEDAGTVTSPLVPWNTCGAYIYGVLGISAFAYAPFCVFNWLCPIISSLYGILDFKITRIEGEAAQAG